MAQTAQVTAEVRSQLGSRANKRLRDAGRLPGVVYGHKEAVVPVVLPKKEVVNHLNKGTHVFSLALDGKAENVLVKEVQYDHLGIEVIHVDFARVNLDERVTVTVPIELKGDPVGEKEGGILQQVLSEIEVECLVTEIPNAIVVNVSDLKVDDAIHVKELKLPAGVKALQDEDSVVVQVKTITEEEAAPAAEEGAAEPEVIGRKADDEAEAEAK
ncbi:MAG TPA: 50S ribosomal protein L25 [Tepidisphaeraceae bacterium]|nr:50S ribosomal protein L25 [Tepidisphaeraceae bacterium]